MEQEAKEICPGVECRTAVAPINTFYLTDSTKGNIKPSGTIRKGEKFLVFFETASVMYLHGLNRDKLPGVSKKAKCVVITEINRSGLWALNFEIYSNGI